MNNKLIIGQNITKSFNDGDLSVNVLDVVETVNLIINGGYNITADIDSNGAVNVLDIIQLINIIIDRS